MTNNSDRKLVIFAPSTTQATVWLREQGWENHRVALLVSPSNIDLTLRGLTLNDEDWEVVWLGNPLDYFTATQLDLIRKVWCPAPRPVFRLQQMPSFPDPSNHVGVLAQDLRVGDRIVGWAEVMEVHTYGNQTVVRSKNDTKAMYTHGTLVILES